MAQQQPSMQDLIVEHQKQWQAHLVMTGSTHDLNNPQIPHNNNHNTYILTQNSNNTQQMIYNNNNYNNYGSATNLNNTNSPQQFAIWQQQQNNSYSAMNVHNYQQIQQMQQQPSQQQIITQTNAQNHSQRSLFQQQARNNINQNYYASTGQLGMNNNNFTTQNAHAMYNYNTNQQLNENENEELPESIDYKHETFVPPIPQSKQEIQKYVNWQAQRNGISEQKKIDLQIIKRQQMSANIINKNKKHKTHKNNFISTKSFPNQKKSNIIIYESWLHKKGKFNTAMQLRYCKLYKDRKLAYFRDIKDKKAAGIINLYSVYIINVYLPKIFNSDLNDIIDVTKIKRDGYAINIKSIELKGNKNNYGFELITNKRIWIFTCSKSNEFIKWIDNLRDLCFGKLLHFGYLMKVNTKHKNWKQRFCVMYDLNEIRYFEDDTLVVQKGVIDLKKVTKILACDENQYKYTNCIELYTSERIWVLSTKRKEDREIWMNEIRNVMNIIKYDQNVECVVPLSGYH
eukprot:362990_1